MLETPLIVPSANSVVAGVDGAVGQLLFIHDVVEHQRVHVMAYSISDAQPIAEVLLELPPDVVTGT